jgi:membrane-associated protease RseP (regulator of RpoE activity)
VTAGVVSGLGRSIPAWSGRVRRAYLGLVNTPVQLPVSSVVRTGHRDGLLVVEVLPRSPAERAGLRAGDVLLSVGRKSVSNAGAFRSYFSRRQSAPLDISALRDGTELHVVAVPRGNDGKPIALRRKEEFSAGKGRDCPGPRTMGLWALIIDVE